VSDADLPVGSGPPAPRRRSFATGILPAAHSDAAGASPSWLRWAAYAGSRGAGGPSLSSSPRQPPSRERCGRAERAGRGAVVRLTPLRFQEAAIARDRSQEAAIA